MMERISRCLSYLPSGESSGWTRALLVCFVLILLPWLEGNSCDLLYGVFHGLASSGEFPLPRQESWRTGFHGAGA